MGIFNLTFMQDADLEIWVMLDGAKEPLLRASIPFLDWHSNPEIVGRGA